MSISIEDYEIKMPSLVADQVLIEVSNLELGTSVTLRVSFMKMGNLVTLDVMRVDGEDYANWGTDDTYLENLVIQKYGLVKKPTIEQTTAPIIVQTIDEQPFSPIIDEQTTPPTIEQTIDEQTTTNDEIPV